MELSSQILSDITIHMKYARYEEKKHRRELWKEIVYRNAQMHIDKFPELKKEILEAYTDYVLPKKVLPSMRSIQFAGKPVKINPARIYNCFKSDTKFITSKGVESFDNFDDGDTVTVLSHDGSWNNAIVRNYGKQKLNEITFVRGNSNDNVVYATENHRWILSDGIETINLKVGDSVLASPNIFDDFNYDNATPFEKLYWCYGFVYGDGTLNKDSDGNYKYSMLRLCGNDSRFENRFKEMGFETSSSLSLSGDVMVYTGKYLKTIPDLNKDSVELLRAFIHGYLQADGGKSRDNTMLSKYVNIQATGEDNIEFIRKYFPVVGVIITSEEDLTGQITNFGERKEKTIRFKISTNLQNKTNMKWKVKSIRETNIVEDVWCLEVENTKSFVLSNGISTGNCAFLPIDDWRAFSETMFLLLGGTGVGYSVQKHHIEKLPEIHKPKKTKRYLIGDSIEGWADAVKSLMKAYLSNGTLPIFDFSDIRPKGARLITAGGKAPGPEPLKECLISIKELLDRKPDGSKLTPFEAHILVCLIADAVLAGGIRRAALIALFSFDDDEMLTCKSSSIKVEKLISAEHPKYTDKDGLKSDISKMVLNFIQNGVEYKNIVIYKDEKSGLFYDMEQYKSNGTFGWWVANPHLGRANNSAVALRHRINKRDFNSLWKKIKDSHSGEPGIYFSNDMEWGTNPCVEIALRPFQFCNLVEINGNDIESQEEFNKRARVASFIATLQASYTDFHYLRDIWQKTTEKDALLGVGITGIGGGKLDKINLTEGAEIVKEENKRVAKLIGINPANRTTCVKPSGTSSLVLGTSSGIHAWHGEYYIRRIRVGKNEAIYSYLKNNHPELLEDDAFKPDIQAVISVPQKAPYGAILRENETALKLLERVKRFNLEWVKPGHINGHNTHNVSCTVSVKDDEWDDVGKWMWENRDTFNGLSILPFNGGTYKQAPFETISKTKYYDTMKILHEIDLSKVVENGDDTDLKGELACSGGACEV